MLYTKLTNTLCSVIIHLFSQQILTDNQLWEYSGKQNKVLDLSLPGRWNRCTFPAPPDKYN